MIIEPTGHHSLEEMSSYISKEVCVREIIRECFSYKPFLYKPLHRFVPSHDHPALLFPTKAQAMLALVVGFYNHLTFPGTDCNRVIDIIYGSAIGQILDTEIEFVKFIPNGKIRYDQRYLTVHDFAANMVRAISLGNDRVVAAHETTDTLPLLEIIESRISRWFTVIMSNLNEEDANRSKMLELVEMGRISYEEYS
eukprot:GHVH01003663.1.p1 GENE.GHVH01003663.1~~GHVH01003663.1.p1  ORF type:complete len:196 (+),score=15.55 GHVH01003663.1:95-682(+)